jgi:hypothetical protein
VPNVTYTRGKAIFSGSADWASDKQVFKMLLAGGKYEADHRHTHVSDVSPYEITGPGYKRQIIAGRSVVQNDDQKRADCLADAVTLKGLTTNQSYRWIVIYKAGESDADSDLVCAIDMTEVSLKGTSEHTIRWDGQEKSGRAFSIT